MRCTQGYISGSWDATSWRNFFLEQRLNALRKSTCNNSKNAASPESMSCCILALVAKTAAWAPKGVPMPIWPAFSNSLVALSFTWWRAILEASLRKTSPQAMGLTFLVWIFSIPNRLADPKMFAIGSETSPRSKRLQRLAIQVKDSSSQISCPVQHKSL